MVRLVALLALAAAPSPPGAGAPASALRLPAALLVRRPPAPPPRPGPLVPRLAPPAGARPSGEPAVACALDLCPAEPRYPGARPVAVAARPGRTELFLRLVERSRLEPVASAARLLQAVPLRVDWSPPTDDAGAPLPPGRGAFGKVVVSLRLRLDAHNRWAAPARDVP